VLGKPCSSTAPDYRLNDYWLIGSAVLRSSRQKVSTLYNRRPFPSILPLLMGDLNPHLIPDSLGPSEHTFQTASRSVQLYSHRWPYSVQLYFTVGAPFPKIAPSHGRSRPPSNTWFLGPIRAQIQTASRSVQKMIALQALKALNCAMNLACTIKLLQQ